MASSPPDAAAEPFIDPNDAPADDDSDDDEEFAKASLCQRICGCLICLTLIPLACLGLCCCCVTSAADNAVHKAQGKRWDGVQNKWVVDNLEEDESSVAKVPKDDEDILKHAKEEEEESKQDGTNDGAAAAAAVKETEYYAALGVPTDATESQIKKAYYIQARKWHPDKNQSDEAKQKFQIVGEAYQVLGDKDLRAVYDKEGKDGLSGDKTEVAMNAIDPSLVFTFLFGNDSFDDIVGRLQLVTNILVGGGEEESAKPTVTKRQRVELERRRVVRLALSLRSRIERFVADETDVEGATAAWTREAERLVEVRYGEQILNTVGTMYKLVATEVIGSWSEGMDAKAKMGDMKWDAVKNAASAAQKTAQEPTEEEGGGGDDALPAMIEIMWNMTVIDISTTLREVVMKVLKDASVSKDVRKKRAIAVRRLGEIWENQKSVGPLGDSSHGRHQQSVRTMYASATKAAMEATIDKMKKEEDEKRSAASASSVSLD